MTFIVLAYILWVSPENLKGAPVGFGLPYFVALALAAVFALVLILALVKRGKNLSRDKSFSADE